MTIVWPLPPAPPPALVWWRRLLSGVRGGGLRGPVPAPAPPTLAELYHARRLRLVRLAVLLVDDLATAEDVVQDVFTALHRRHGDDLGRLADPEAYLVSGVLNRARSELRRRRTARAWRPPPATSPAAEDEALLDAGDQQVLAALRTLTARQRQVVVLRYWAELSEAEIADTLRVSRGTVKSTASRALAVLRRRLAGRWP